MKKIKTFILLMGIACIGAVSSVKTEAAGIDTGVHSSSGPYNLYIHKAGNLEELGISQMWYDSETNTVHNKFTATEDCEVTVYVSPIASGYVSKKDSLKAGESVEITKTVNGKYKETYGYCIVDYK